MVAKSHTKTKNANESIKFSEKPLVVLAQILVVPVILALLGWYITSEQNKISHQREDAESSNKAVENREQVLTDYSNTIAELMTENKEATDQEYISNYNKQNIARGHTFIALRRLNISDKKGKDDEGKLKGLLIRYLYELHLIDNYELDAQDIKVWDKADINLSGADIDNVVLKNAWMPEIDLTGAWLRNSDFTKAALPGATLIKAQLKGADLTSTDLTRADLRFADLTDVTITDTTELTGACYVKGLGGTIFPPDFKPDEKKMIAIPGDNSDPDKPAQFQPCLYPR